jgi:hypothetical protein
MNSFDDRARRARDDLASAFDDLRVPDFGALQARQRHRRVAAGGVATVLVLALGIVAAGIAGRDDPPKVATIDTTSAPTVARPTVPTTGAVTPTLPTSPSTSSPSVTATPTTTTPTTQPTPSITVSGPEPSTLVAVRDDGTLVRLRTQTGAVTTVLASKTSGERPATRSGADLTIGRDGRVFYEGCCGTTSGAVYDLHSKKSQPRLQGTATSAPPTLIGRQPVASPDGAYLALHDASRIEIYELATGKRVRTIVSRSARPKILHMAMADDGRVAVEVPGAGAKASRAIYVMAGNARSMDDVTFSVGYEFLYATVPAYMPDGRLVYAAVREAGEGMSQPGPTRLHLASATGSDVEITPDLPFGVLDLAVSSSGHLLVTGSDHVLRAFDGTTWHDVARGYTAADW